VAHPRLSCAALVLAFVSSGCSAAVAPPARPAVPPAALPRAAARAPGGFEPGFEILSSAAQGVRFPLPAASRWSIRDGGSGGLIATHAATSSRLVIRAFRDASPYHGASCEAQARAADRTIPLLGAERVEQRRLRLERDYELALDVAVAPDPDAVVQHALRGYALAFGGDGRRCLSVVFSTRASGVRADAVVAERLGLIVESTFARMRLRSIDERVLAPRP
jgi:hypothetical protein